MGYAMRSLFQTSISGGISSSVAAGPAKRPFVLPSFSTATTACPLKSVRDRSCEAYARPPRNASSTSTVESNSSTLAGARVLTVESRASGYHGTEVEAHLLNSLGSTVGARVEDSLPSWEAAEPSPAHTTDPAAARATSSTATAPKNPCLRDTGASPRSTPDARVDIPAEVAATMAYGGDHPRQQQQQRQQPQPQAPSDEEADSPRYYDPNQEPQPIASTSAPTDDRSASSRTSPHRRGETHHTSPRPSPASPSPPPPRRPRLRPPPPPLSWPDYPYTRRSAASACASHDTPALKLEALFQCVLNYPRIPPRLLRFLRRAAPGGVEGQLPYVTATVERLSGLLGRELALYLIRRKPWVALVGPDSIGPRLDLMQRLLQLPPQGLMDLLRKNPNLLRLHNPTLLERHGALHHTTGFNPEQVRALLIKYPLILNFRPESVHSAAVALRRLCSTRPSWAAHHALLSPSQFAFYMRERIQTLLRLEYLLITGGGGSWTIRDIMKTSNNMFKMRHPGYRTWMTERLRRLQERLARARAAARAQTAPDPPPLPAVLQAEDLAKRESWVAQQQEFREDYLRRRDEERGDEEYRVEQRKWALREKKEQEEEAKRREAEEEERRRREEMARIEANQRAWEEQQRLQQQQQQREQEGMVQAGPASTDAQGSQMQAGSGKLQQEQQGRMPAAVQGRAWPAGGGLGSAGVLQPQPHPQPLQSQQQQQQYLQYPQHHQEQYPEQQRRQSGASAGPISGTPAVDGAFPFRAPSLPPPQTLPPRPPGEGAVGGLASSPPSPPPPHPAGVATEAAPGVVYWAGSPGRREGPSTAAGAGAINLGASPPPSGTGTSSDVASKATDASGSTADVSPPPPPPQAAAAALALAAGGGAVPLLGFQAGQRSTLVRIPPQSVPVLPKGDPLSRVSLGPKHFRRPGAKVAPPDGGAHGPIPEQRRQQWQQQQ